MTTALHLGARSVFISLSLGLICNAGRIASTYLGMTVPYGLKVNDKDSSESAADLMVQPQDSAGDAIA